MRERRHVAWLYQQLPGLVADGTLSSEAAQNLRRRYGEAGGESGPQGVTLFGVLGAVLIGCGIILLIAYNWDDLGRATRVALCFTPLVLAQAIAAWALWRRPESAAWRESAGSFLALAIGASIALVSQTYDIGGDLGDFLLTWTLLALPIAYVMRATLPALLYLVGIAAWAGAQWTSSAEALGYWGLLGLVMPWWRLEAKQNPYRSPPIIFAWLFALVLPFGVAASLRSVLDVHATWLLLASAIAGALFLAGLRFWGEAPSTIQKPLQTLGALALILLGLAFTFEEAWRSQIGAWGSGAQALKNEFLSQPLAWTIVVLWLGGWLCLWIDSFRCKDPLRTFLGAMPLFLAAGLALTNVGHSFSAMLLFNAYLFALGVGVLLSGLRGQSLGRVNGGMLILAAVILFRFFDVDLGFIPRAVAFILLGAGFLAVNVVMARRRGVATP
ncbi:DUF2157 domain-containing protein [Methylocystis bryophila]|uniref:DUF2157 domain-containing protein n=1 Tax=Methylocystis bryophila TaxID=655015 RepID=A0A1W6MRL7_9HYPH|nr:DUF2157 domain-containing protein [Methylocystis bryophila]ARN80119.1 hypothetical protein B1812_02425 [Methylocystis bryophila]BDV40060.1 hypothetical protein DSM21852_33130 [Methylocystis bryophila]